MTWDRMHSTLYQSASELIEKEVGVTCTEIRDPDDMGLVQTWFSPWNNSFLSESFESFSVYRLFLPFLSFLCFFPLARRYKVISSICCQTLCLPFCYPDKFIALTFFCLICVLLYMDTKFTAFRELAHQNKHSCGCEGQPHVAADVLGDGAYTA